MEGRIASVLVVDDDRVVAQLAAEILRGAGHEVHIAHDPQTALALVKANAVDVVLTDVVLGAVDGVELAESVASLRPNTTVIFMSGYGAHARGPAADDPVLTKPFSPDQLCERVAAALR
jgi:two-component system cell cycle sensor histidine kinase/response regulator CckA